MLDPNVQEFINECEELRVIMARLMRAELTNTGST